MEDTLKLISIQHELGMAIGLDIRLQPMLNAFTQVCIRRLGLTAVNIYFDINLVEFSAQFNEAVGPLARVFSMPDQLGEELDVLNGLYSEAMAEPKPWLQHYSDTDQEYLYLFLLENIGLVVLRRKQDSLASCYLELLSPIFKRLAISCQGSIEHEQLLAAIEARRAAESTIVFQLYHDELTRLPNRRALMESLNLELLHAEKHELLAALLFLDLDRFKAINDTLGHGVGDELLKATAQLLIQSVRAEDHVARLSGDEFVIVLTKIKSDKQEVYRVVDKVLSKIQEAFSKSIQAGEHLLHISPSIGVEIFPRAGIDADRILRNADTAMYLAKQQGQFAAVFYQDHMSADLDIRLDVEKRLQQAIKTCEQFKLVYQPQYNEQGVCLGAEALIRWQDDTGRNISPMHFIPVAEETGLMLELGYWVIETACRHLAELNADGLPPEFEKISVNVSAVQFNQIDFTEILFKAIARHDVAPSTLGIELTESALIQNVNSTREKIALLRAKGIDVSVDDFGTGYSSLSYLNRFPITTLKIDQSFVRRAHVDSGNRAIVETIIALAKSLSLNVIAEGVETYEELACLQKMECFQYQGFYLSPPLDFQDFREALKAQARSSTRPQDKPGFRRRHTDS